MFVSCINFSDSAVDLNKGMKIAKIRPCVDFTKSEPDKAEVCYNINAQPPIGNFDHADLSWSSEINLDHLDPPTKEKVKNFLNNNKDVFAASVLDLPGCTTIPHTIKLTNDKPVKCKAYRVPHNLKQEMEDQLDILLKANIIAPSVSEFASPVILVKKADGGYRLAVDFRKLNKNLVKDAYPIPNITDSVDALSGGIFFSTLDLTSGFFQQVIDPSDRHKTAIITHKGLFEWTRNCFGLSTSGNSFQRLMSTIFGDLSNLAILVYIDDIVIASVDVESHLQKLLTVFNRLRQHNLKLKPSKCTFLANKIKYLGFEIEKGQVSPINKNIEVIQNFQIPGSRKAVRSFIGTVSFYRRFIPDFSKRTKNLINLTKDNKRFAWTPEAQAEFEDMKAALISKPCLALPDFNKEFYLYTDASGGALGAVLSQMDDNNLPHPVAFASRKLRDPETRYSATERELLALVWATAHFKCYLANTHFYIYTDHAPLTYMLKIQDPTSRMAKWICTLSDFDFTIRYIEGKCNSVADFLSRFINNDCDNADKFNFCLRMAEPSIFVPHSDLLEKIKIAQKSDPKCCKIVDRISKDLEVKPQYMRFFLREDILVSEDMRKSHILKNNIKLVVPLELVPQVFTLTHESLAACHQGFQKTIDRIREHFYWPGMSTHVKNLVDSCVSCQQKRAHKVNQLAPLQRMPTPDYPLKKIHLDIIGPLKTSFSGNRFIVSYIDSFSKWPEAYAVSSITSDVIADTLADFISRYGAPSYITTDNAKNLVCPAIEKVYKGFGIRHIPTSPYHAAGNAQVERQHKTMCNALSHIVDENHSDWDTKLKFALLAMRTAVHSSTKLTPAAVMFGRNLNLPYSIFSQPPHINYNDAPSFCELLIPALQKVYGEVHGNLVKVSEAQEKYQEKSATIKDIKIGDQVWLFTPVVKINQCKKFAKQNSGPFTVIEKLSEVNFKIALVSKPSVIKVTHVNNLAKATSRMNFPNSCDQNEPAGSDSEIRENLANNDISLEGGNHFLRRKRRRNFVCPAFIPAVINDSPLPGSSDDHSGSQGSSNVQLSTPEGCVSQQTSGEESGVTEGVDNTGVSFSPVSGNGEEGESAIRRPSSPDCISIIEEATENSIGEKSKGNKRQGKSKTTSVKASPYALRPVKERKTDFRY